MSKKEIEKIDKSIDCKGCTDVVALKKIDLTHTVAKKEYKAEMAELRIRLAELQRKLLDLKIPVVIVFEGWGASGKGTCISKILYPLDPRHFNVYSMDKIPEEVAMRPFLWDYWRKIPSKGRITIFDKSWHRYVLPERIEKRPLSHAETNGFYYDVESFERKLTDDGVLIVKFFLHISQEDQKARFDKLLGNPDTEWRIDKHDLLQNRDYKSHLKYFEDMIIKSNFDFCRWNIIEANDFNYAAIKMYKILINKIEKVVNKAENISCDKSTQDSQKDKVHHCEFAGLLASVNPDKEISQNEYKEQLDYYQDKLSHLEHKLYIKRKPVVIVYEGWDAAGKGGNISRMTQKLDPRGYEVIPISAPSQEELSRHYLWRFWKSAPKDGHIAIYDRSWYGRVLVERVEKFCSDTEWQRAYKEINDMEIHLHNHGAIIFKFWLQISKEEQLKRFQLRDSDPLKQYKITEEDWRNRAKWDDYEKAVDEMIGKTSTNYAPWTIVESNNKKYARIKTLKMVVDTLELELR